MSHRTEKTGAHLQTKSIYKQNQTEVLCILQSVGSYGYPEMPGYNSHKKHKRDAKRHIGNLHFAEGESYGTD